MQGCPRGYFGLVLFINSLFPLASIYAQETPASPVRYTEARNLPLRRSLQLPGSVEASRVSTVASEIAGLVVEFTGQEGRRVNEGEVLVRLKRDNLEVNLKAAEAQLKEDEARHQLARRNLERMRELYNSKDVSQKQLDDATFEFGAWEARLERLKAEIARISDDLKRSVITAPFRGVIVRKRTELGEWIVQGGPVVELQSLDELEVAAEIPERYFGSLHTGTIVPTNFESVPGLTVSGRVSAVIPRADTQARTFRIKVRIPNPGGRVGVGMLAQISLPQGESYRATMVPKDAVVAKGPQKLIYLINAQNTVEEIPVQTGAGMGAWIEVEGGVQPGRKVITRGNERLMAGQPVQGQPLEVKLP